jgi:hypothetical protein
MMESVQRNAVNQEDNANMGRGGSKRERDRMEQSGIKLELLVPHVPELRALKPERIECGLSL